eukprot:Sspe_Gene.74495::Locus_46261_Transcript_1_1_Confidence_1.000_Length_681::g.74495::m.74495
MGWRENTQLKGVWERRSVITLALSFSSTHLSKAVSNTPQKRGATRGSGKFQCTLMGQEGFRYYCVFLGGGEGRGGTRNTVCGGHSEKILRICFQQLSLLPVPSPLPHHKKKAKKDSNPFLAGDVSGGVKPAKNSEGGGRERDREKGSASIASSARGGGGTAMIAAHRRGEERRGVSGWGVGAAIIAAKGGQACLFFFLLFLLPA